MRHLTRTLLVMTALIGFACSGCQSLRLGGDSGSDSGCCSLPSGSCDYNPGCDSLTGGCDSGGCGGCDSGGCDSGGCDGGGCDAMGSHRQIVHRQIVRGRKMPLLDQTASFLGVANKLALWDSRADNHNISPQTESAVLNYLQYNGLGQTLVRVNQYDPVGEWRRLTSNKRIAAPYRYTVGTYDWLKYTLLPGRLVGGDWYNPFTDSVHLYSDIPAIGLSKAAYAKDVYSRPYPGTYASIQDAPMVGLYHETLANKEVINHVKRHGTASQLQEAERILYPDLAGSVGAQALGFLPYGSVYGRAAGALVGHAARAIKGGTAGFTMPN